VVLGVAATKWVVFGGRKEHWEKSIGFDIPEKFEHLEKLSYIL